MILLLETVLGPFLVWLFVGEAPGAHAFWGGGIVLGVLALHSMAREADGRTTLPEGDEGTPGGLRS